MRINITASVLLFVLSSCTTGTRRLEYPVTVDAINSPAAMDKRTYVVVPRDSTTNVRDLQYQEYAAQVVRGLELAGFAYADSLPVAHLVVVLGYGVGDPIVTTSEYHIPIIGVTGVRSASTLGSFTLYGGGGSFASRTVTTPQYGVTGYHTVEKQRINYAKYVALSAIDYQAFLAGGQVDEVWRTVITCVDRDPEFRRSFSRMVAAAAEFYGHNPGMAVSGVQRDSSPATMYVRGQGPKPEYRNGRWVLP